MEQSSWKDELKASCAVVLGALQVNYSSPKDDGWEHIDGAIDHISCTAGVRYRRVSLDDAWWKKDCGPLLGFTADGRPQALIPGVFGVYQVYDPLHDRTTQLKDAVAAHMQPYGYVFYPLLPASRLSMANVKTFAGRFGLLHSVVEYAFFIVFSNSLGLVFILALQRLLLGEKQVLQLALAVLAISIAALLFRLKGQMAWLWMEGRVEFFLQAAFWDRLLRLPRGFFSNKPSWSLADHVLGVSHIRNLVTTVMAPGFLAFGAMVLHVGFISLYDWRIAVLSMAVIAVWSILLFQLGHKQAPYRKQLEGHNEQMTAFTVQIPNAMARIRNSGAEEAVVNHWMKLYDQQVALKEKLATVVSKIDALNRAFSVAVFGIMLFAAWSISHWIPLAVVFMTFFLALRQIKVWQKSVSGIPSIKQVVLQMEPISETLPECLAADEALIGRIELIDVTFCYPDRSILFDRVSLTIEAGEYVGIIGATGCGKSTLLKLLLGFVQPSAGHVLYDCCKAPLQQIGVVLQTSTLAYGSILYNIMGGDSCYTLEDAWQATSLAALADEIKSMPLGMQTILGPGGTPLSGGQRQRLLIAKALIHHPRILLLDEATSSIDSKTLKQIMQNLRALEITRIVASHRPDVLRDCDRLIRIQAGKFVEEKVG